MGNQTKRLLFLTDVEKVDAKLVAVAISQATVSIELSDRIGFDLDKVEFTIEKDGEVLRFRLVDP